MLYLGIIYPTLNLVHIDNEVGNCIAIFKTGNLSQVTLFTTFLLSYYINDFLFNS